MTVEICIPGKPVGKGRPRFTRAGGVYTDKQTRAKEREIAQLAKISMLGKAPLVGAVLVRIHIWMTGERTAKPDADNVQKLLCDALNGIVWTDDKNVVDIHTIKHGRSSDERTIIHIEAA